jgi:hypothetical protein
VCATDKGQRRSVAAVAALRGQVTYAAPSAQPRRGASKAFPRPPFLRHWLPRDYFDAVLWVSLNGNQVTDAGLMHLRGMKGLQQLYLDDTQITDAGLANLHGLTGPPHNGFEYIVGAFGLNQLAD